MGEVDIAFKYNNLSIKSKQKVVYRYTSKQKRTCTRRAPCATINKGLFGLASSPYTKKK